MDAADVVVGEAALGLQPLDAAGVGFPRAERADVEAVAFQRDVEPGIVDLRDRG